MWKTGKGKKYHIRSCHHVTSKSVKVTDFKGLTPCAICNPDESDLSDSTWTGEVTKSGKGYWICKEKSNEDPTTGEIAGLVKAGGKWNKHKKCFIFTLAKGIKASKSLNMTEIVYQTMSDDLKHFKRQGVKLIKHSTSNKQTKNKPLGLKASLTFSGRGMWISGDTKSHKKTLKSHGGTWKSQQNKWLFTLENGMKAAKATNITEIVVRAEHLPAKQITKQGFNVITE